MLKSLCGDLLNLAAEIKARYHLPHIFIDRVFSATVTIGELNNTPPFSQVYQEIGGFEQNEGL